MLVKARYDKNNSWGLLEKYESYQYNRKGYVKALVSVTKDGSFAPIYAFRGEEFIPLDIIDAEVGIDRYVKAKKPLYSKVGEGFLVLLKAEVDYANKVYYPDKSTYEVYTLNGTEVDVSKGLPFKRVLDVPKEFENLVKEPLRILGESFGKKEEFLRKRIENVIGEE